MNKEYVCERFPSLALRSTGRQVEFLNGWYQTEEPALQQLIESNDLYGIYIHERDTVEAEALAKARASVPGAGVAAGKGEGATTVKVRGKAEAEKMSALYGEPVEVSGSWYTFDTSKKGGASD